MMTTEFVLRINIGNEATLGDANLADIVRKVADSIALVGIENNRHFRVRDAYGNVVGQFGRYDEEDDDDDEVTCTQQEHDEAEWDNSGYPRPCDRCGKPKDLGGKGA